jgi:hypothetical protein
MSASKTARAAEAAVARGNKKADVVLTPEQTIQSIRNNLASRLAVTPEAVRVLLAEYDAVHALLAQSSAIHVSGAQALEVLGQENEDLKAQLINSKQKTEETFQANAEVIRAAGQEIETLKAKNEEFRQVYEQENLTRTVHFSQSPMGAPDSLESGSVESVPEVTE